MSDQRKKLDALIKAHGLISGAEVSKPATRKKAAPAPSKPNPPAPGTPNPNETLRELTARLGMASASDWQQQREEDWEAVKAGDFEIDKVLEGEIVGNEEEGGFFLLRQDFPITYSQGNVPLGAALDSESQHIALSAKDDELVDFDPRKTLFIDTETTGLAGGAGTLAFLVGVGYFTEEGFRLDQCFLRDYDDEEPMLIWLAERFRDCDTVVGYNSKSFDLPLLRTRFIQNRIPFPLNDAPHYDLVHAARRLWKRRIKACNLGNVEREILGLHRQDDVPSYLIPELWFDYLESRDARPLEGVFYHHRMDILSLASLTGWISQCLSAPEGRGFTHDEDRLSVVRIHYQQKKYGEVTQLGMTFLDDYAQGPLRRECFEMLGIACKRMQQWVDMQAHFERLLEEFPGDMTAVLELAKHYEHRARNLLRAKELCQGALDHYGDTPPPEAHALQHRLERILRKLSAHLEE